MNCGQVDRFCGCQLPVFRQNWSALRLIRSKLDGCTNKFGHVQSNPQFRMKKVSRSFHLCNLVEWHGLSGVGDLNLGRVFVVSHVFNTPEPVLTIATHVQIQCDKSEHVQHAVLHSPCALLKTQPPSMFGLNCFLRLKSISLQLSAPVGFLMSGKLPISDCNSLFLVSFDSRTVLDPSQCCPGICNECCALTNLARKECILIFERAQLLDVRSLVG